MSETCSFCKKVFDADAVLMDANNNKYCPQCADKLFAQQQPTRAYTKKANIKRFFWPHEWLKFLSIINNDEHKFLFEFLLHTGMRFNEAKNIEMRDIDFDRETINIRMTKGGANKQRTIQISGYLKNRIVAYTKTKGIKTGRLLIFSKNKRPPSIQFIDKVIKKYCAAAGITDPENFSCHNTRKTLENWLIALNINTMGITSHLGHAVDVAQGYYVANNLMKNEDKILIKTILDNLLNK